MPHPLMTDSWSDAVILRGEDRLPNFQPSTFATLIQYIAHTNWAKLARKYAAGLIFLMCTIKL